GHDRDFATIENVLVEILQKYGNVRLFIAGPLEISEKFDQVRDKIEQVSFAPMNRHFINIANVDINLIPLEDDDFCRAKSEIKFIEAGIVGVPTIAFSNQTFQEATENGVSGFLAMNNEEWKEKIENLIENKELRKTIGQKAKETVMKKYTTKSEGNREYYEFLNSTIDAIKK
ncbi:MAG: glycosyltransferase, partial [Patescibacteria group bacterium]|nr:glycosyltransferase [Patescibacteria group bacterium]